MSDNIGQRFIKETSYLSDIGDEPEILNEPFPPNPELKSFTDLVAFEPSAGLQKIISQRRTVRLFEDKPISLECLSKLIWGVQGVTATKGANSLRSVASAGNRHPLNTYVVANNVEGIAKGLYFYDRINDRIGLLRNDSFENELNEASLGQSMVNECCVTFIWTAVSARTTERYQARGYRYIFLDAGHIGAQIQLLCCDMGLGSCNIAAYLDDSLAKFLNLKSEFEFPVYMTVVGWPKLDQ